MRRPFAHRSFASCCALVALATSLISLPVESRAQPPVDDRLLLDGAGVDAVVLAKLVDGTPLSIEEQSPLASILSGLRQCSQLDLDRYSRKPTSPADLASAAARGRLWQVRGRLKAAVAEELTTEQLERIYAEIDELPPTDVRRKMYRCEVALDGGGPTAIVYSLRLPKALVGKAKLDEAVSLQGVELKNAGTEAAPQPIFATRHLSWYPDTPLGKLGMDYALYDDVRREAHDLKFERECFYQLLNAMKKVDFAQLLEQTEQPRPASVVPLFNDPETMTGKLIQLDGSARRAVAVVVEDADIVERFGIKRYFEVAIFTSDSQNNPLLFNVLELPPGFPEGDSINERVQIPGTYLTGFYYRRDQLPNEKIADEKAPLQKAPLLLGKSLVHLPKLDAAAAQQSSYAFAGIILVAVMVLAYAVWRTTRTETQTRELLQRQMAPPPGTSLNDAPVEYQAKPDFSGIDADADDEDDDDEDRK